MEEYQDDELQYHCDRSREITTLLIEEDLRQWPHAY